MTDEAARTRRVRIRDASTGTIVRALYGMARPSQLALVVLVYGLGVTIAAAHGRPVDATIVLKGGLVLVPVAASIHYANEYADHETDALTSRTPFSGGSGVLPRTGLPPVLAKYAAIGAAAVGAGLAVWWIDGLTWPSAALLAVGLIGGWQYSVGPLRAASRGAGEATNALLGGLVLPTYGYAVVAGVVTVEAVLACVPFTFVVFVNLLETTWPDRHADAAAGQRTLAVRLSPPVLRRIYRAGSIASVASLVLLAGSVIPWPVAIPSLLPMALLAWGSRRYTRREYRSRQSPPWSASPPSKPSAGCWSPVASPPSNRREPRSTALRYWVCSGSGRYR